MSEVGVASIHWRAAYPAIHPFESSSSCFFNKVVFGRAGVGLSDPYAD
jgi:hypothetical protein